MKGDADDNLTVSEVVVEPVGVIIALFSATLQLFDIFDQLQGHIDQGHTRLRRRPALLRPPDDGRQSAQAHQLQFLIINHFYHSIHSNSNAFHCNNSFIRQSLARGPLASGPEHSTNVRPATSWLARGPTIII